MRVEAKLGEGGGQVREAGGPWRLRRLLMTMPEGLGQHDHRLARTGPRPEACPDGRWLRFIQPKKQP